MLRQGDVLLVPAGSIDLSQATLDKSRLSASHVVLAEGEATGHAHTMSVETSTPMLFGGREIVVVEKPSILTHQEHNEIEVSPGVYWVVHQREYSPQAIRRVLD